MVLLTLGIIYLHCRGHSRWQERKENNAEEEVARMRQRELVDSVMREGFGREDTRKQQRELVAAAMCERGLDGAPGSVPSLHLESQACRRQNMTMPKPFPLPSFRRWLPQLSARAGPEQRQYQQQVEEWLREERKMEDEIDAMRWELRDLDGLCAVELRQMEERELAEMEASVARIVDQERVQWAELLRACQDDRDQAAHAREEWAAAAPEREQQMGHADNAILELLSRLKELRKLRKEALLPRGQSASSSPAKRTPSAKHPGRSDGAANADANLPGVSTTATATSMDVTTKKVKGTRREPKPKAPSAVVGSNDPKKAARRANALKSAVMM